MTRNELKTRVLSINHNQTTFDKAECIATTFPSLKNEIIKDADNMMRNMWILPGTGNRLFFIGSPTKWIENPTGDNEYLFQLNRMENLKVLSEAFSLTKDEKYAEKAISELLNWIENIKCPPTIKNSKSAKENFDGPSSGAWRALETGIRMYRTIPIMLEQLVFSESLSDNDLAKIISSIKEHMDVLYAISPLLWPNADHNHYLMENLGLYTMSLFFPELDPNGKYRDHANRELLRCMNVQCTDEGAQIEGCPSYHNGCVYWFSLKNHLERHYGITSDVQYTEKLKKMFLHSLYATRNLGTNIPWGDSHTYPKETCSIAAVGMYLATGNIEYLQNAIYFVGSNIVANDIKPNLYRFDDIYKLKADFLMACDNPKKPNLPLIHYAKSIDQIYVRGGWDKSDFTFMSACRTPVKNNHAHIDPCGFDFSMFGETLISDPGIFTYKSGEMRYKFKSTAFHSCPSIDKKDAWEYLGSWKYGKQQEGHILSVENLDNITKIVEKHYNYIPAIITRVFFIVDNKSIVILDIFENLQESNKAYISYHIDSPKINVISPNYISSDKKSKADIDIISSNAEETEFDKGMISDKNESYRESTILRFAIPYKSHKAVHVTLIKARHSSDMPAKAELDFTENNNLITINCKIDDSIYKLKHRT